MKLKISLEKQDLKDEQKQMTETCDFKQFNYLDKFNPVKKGTGPTIYRSRRQDKYEGLNLFKKKILEDLNNREIKDRVNNSVIGVNKSFSTSKRAGYRSTNQSL